MRSQVLRWVGPLCLVLAAGCSSIPRAGDSSAAVASPDTELTGRLSVHYHTLATDHEETVFAGFEWSERGPDVDLDLLNPLGQTMARVHSTPERSTLTLSDGRVYSGATPEGLTEEVLGWRLPVEGLRAWLKGVAARPETPAATLNADGTRRLVENGWTIVYPEDQEAGPPRRLNLSYPGPGIALDLRIVIDSRSGAS